MATETLPSDADLVQFHSDHILQELLQIAAPTVNASLGISGLTSIRKSLVAECLSSRGFDLSRTEQTLNVEFLLTIADRGGEWKMLAVPETSFRYLSTLPVDQSPTDRELLGTIRSLSDDQLTNGNRVGTAAVEIRAGLLLIHESLEPSHQFSQSIEGEGADANGDYWHGLMHRREPDFGNAKYWFRRVGEHPCFVKLAEASRELSGRFQDDRATEWIEKITRSGWDSLVAIDFFQEAHQPQFAGSAFRQFASCLQMQEMLILLTYCCRSFK